jgi:hypothetical protein
VTTARRRWTTFAIALAALAALLLWLVGSSGSGRSATTQREPSAAAPAPRPPPGDPFAGSEARAPAKPAPGATGAPPAPIIDEIQVEKPEVCEGEENLITVRAHDPGGDQASLRYLVNGQPGWQVPLRVRENVEDPNAPARTVLVVGPAGVTTSAPIPAYKIKPCPAAARLRLRHFLLPNSTAEYRLETRMIMGVAPGQPRPDRFVDADFHPTHFQWDFGDGEKAKTTEPYVTHSYEFRDQSTYFTYYALAVTATDDRGRSMVARESLEIMNPAFEELQQKQLVKLMTHNTPRFPEVTDGKVIQTIRVWHFRKEAVPIDAVEAYFYDVNGKELGHAPVKPQDLLGATAVPPGAGLTLRTILEVDKHPGVGFITYQLHGIAAGGQQAMGAFSIMRPPDAPTREKNIPVNDPMMAAKIKRAMELLGKQYVTDEDIWELERQGKLEGLTPIPVEPGDEGPPSWLPRPPRSDGEPWSPDDDPGPRSPEDNTSSPDWE